MSLPVFVHPGVAGVALHESVTLDGDEGRHAVVVKRIRVGERIALTDGRGTTVQGTVTAAARTSLTLEV
jgi:16S rRNA (uracil1498-N3)-methyltransferase